MTFYAKIREYRKEYGVKEHEIDEANADNEIREFLTYRQLDLLSTIRTSVLFFVVLTIIGIVVVIGVQCYLLS